MSISHYSIPDDVKSVDSAPQEIPPSESTYVNSHTNLIRKKKIAILTITISLLSITGLLLFYNLNKTDISLWYKPISEDNQSVANQTPEVTKLSPLIQDDSSWISIPPTPDEITNIDGREIETFPAVYVQPFSAKSFQILDEKGEDQLTWSEDYMFSKDENITIEAISVDENSNWSLIFPSNTTYTLRIDDFNKSGLIEIVYGVGNDKENTSLRIIYLDLLKADVDGGKIFITPNKISKLITKSGDVIEPSGISIGEDMMDNVGPTVTYTVRPVNEMQSEVTLVPYDTSGVKSILFSTQLPNYKQYTTPFIINNEGIPNNKLVKDDTLGNRSFGSLVLLAGN